MPGPWRTVDFAVIWLGGLAGTLIFFGVAQALSTEESGLIVAGLAGQYVGNLGVLAVIARRRAPLGMAIEPGDLRYVGLGILAQIGMAILLEPLARALFPDGRPPQQIAEVIADPSATVLLKLTLFSAAAFLAPVTEELMFRGVLLKAFEGRGPRVALIVSSTVFALVHLFGVDPERFWASALVVVPPILALGLWLGWLTLKKGRLGPAIFLHSGWNLVAAIVLLLPAELLESAV